MIHVSAGALESGCFLASGQWWFQLRMGYWGYVVKSYFFKKKVEELDGVESEKKNI